MSAASVPRAIGLRLLSKPGQGEGRLGGPPVPTTPLIGRATALAEHLLGAAEALRDTSGALVAAVDLTRYADLVARVKSHLREDTFATAWREGRELPIDEAMDLALRDDAPQGPGSAAGEVDDAGVLSARERDVARLIAGGRSNRAIADALVVSVKTVETHIQHIFRKLNVKARSEVAVWASRHGLI